MARDSKDDDGQEIVSDEEDWVEYQEDAQLDDKNETFRQHCHYCEREFFSAKKRLLHERSCKVGPIERFTCRVMNLIGVGLWGIFAEHGKISLFQECGLNFKFNQCLLRHVKRHEAPGGFICYSCGDKFTSATARREHRNTQHRVYRCQICQEKLLTQEDYVGHIMNSHSDCKCGIKKKNAAEGKENEGNAKKKAAKLTCEKCGVKFPSKNDLDNHIHSLACEKPYKCKDCGKSFAFQMSLMTHAAQHGGSRQNACEKCGQQFTNYDSLIKHRRANPFTCGLPEMDIRKKNARNMPGTLEKLESKSEKLEDTEIKGQIFNGGIPPASNSLENLTHAVKKEPSPETILLPNDDDALDLDDDLPLSQIKSRVFKKEDTQFVSTETGSEQKDPNEGSERQLRRSNTERKMVYSDSSEDDDYLDLSGPPQSPPPFFTSDSDSDYQERKKKAASGEPDASKLPEFRCNMCPKVYCYQRKLVIHLRSEHGLDSDDDEWPLDYPSKTTYTPRDRKWECQYCKRVYANQSSLSRHIKCHGPNGELLTKCRVCKLFFENDEKLKEHRQEVHKEKITCNICNKSYSGEHNLKTHMALRHSSSNSRPKCTYLCGKCAKSFTSKTALLDHERSDCGKSPIYQCDICQKFYHSAGSLKGHKTLHTKVRPYLCKYCGKPYRTPGQMRDHERVHTGEKPHQCTYCPKRFSHRGSLLTHLSLHTGFKRFMCSGCGQRFTCISNLQAHRKSHADTCGLVPNCTKAMGRMEAYMIPQKAEDVEQQE
uniref:C2H2-type domain-containing protein n=1 Tax=Phlebotomus papatasi TaxID=29031 RepID=A0A1B0DMU1_PHLPP